MYEPFHLPFMNPYEAIGWWRTHIMIALAQIPWLPNKSNNPSLSPLWSHLSFIFPVCNQTSVLYWVGHIGLLFYLLGFPSDDLRHMISSTWHRWWGSVVFNYDCSYIYNKANTEEKGEDRRKLLFTLYREPKLSPRGPYRGIRREEPPTKPLISFINGGARTSPKPD